MELIRRLLDQWRHPGEFETQRQYRRYLEGLDHATPAEPAQVSGIVTDAWEGDIWIDGDAETRARIDRIRKATKPATTVGVTATIERIEE